MAENLKKKKEGYGYKYTELAQINTYLGENGIEYYQFVQTENDTDYIYTVPIIDGKELPARRGCRIVHATLNGKTNPAQEQGSAITYARRYSLLMAFGLATEDDDASSLDGATDQKAEQKKISPKEAADIQAKLLKAMNDNNVPYENICKVYNVESIELMSPNAMQNAIKNIDKINKKAEEMK